MNQYFVNYCVDGSKKRASNFKSLQDAISYKEQKEKEFGVRDVCIWFKEIIPDDLNPYSDTRLYRNEFSVGNIVIYKNELAIIDSPKAALFDSNTIGYFVKYDLLFLSGKLEFEVGYDELEFFGIGESYLVNAWHRKYNLYEDNICLVDMIKEIGR